MADPGFGRVFTDHMVTAAGRRTRLARRPAAAVLPAGAGPGRDGAALRAGDLRGAQGLPAARRRGRAVPPDANARRFRRSARRLAMPELPEELFLAAVEALVGRTASGCRRAGRACTCGRSCSPPRRSSAMRPANEYLFLLIAFPRAPYFPGEVAPGHGVAVRRVRPRRASAAPARRSAPATTPAACSRSGRPPSRAATRSCGSTRSSTAGSRRWAG